MIAYFSGTGNTEWVAAQLSTLVCDSRLVRIPAASPVDFHGVESLGICFPVHAWGVPAVVRQFILSIPQDIHIPYIYMAATCGDDSGLTMHEFQSLLEQRNQHVSSFYTVQMPNSYVNLPGFDVDKTDVQLQKVTAAQRQLQVMAEQIRQREPVTQVVKGDFPWLKSKVIRPVFNRWLMNDSFFHVSSACKGCGTCARVCPVQNICVKDKPEWQHGECLTCMACYHHCPEHAITFGKYTDQKGQYHFKKLKF